MIGYLLCGTLVLIASIATGAAQTTPSSAEPIESPHRLGPNAMEGWTLDYTIPGHASDRYPEVLVLARHGRVIRRISGAPFVWNWIFWADGRQIAYETGPLHFGMLCNLMDIESSRKLASLDCFHELPTDAPAWEKALQAAH